MTGSARRLGFYGFGSAAHLILQVARHRGLEVFAFTRPGDQKAQEHALSLGAAWAGGSEDRPPTELDGAIIFAPVGALVPTALRAVRPGGVVVCAGIHMTDIPSFPYEDLWREKILRSVANLTRKDGQEFLKLAPEIPIRASVTTYAMADANIALRDLRTGAIEGSAVLLADTKTAGRS
jgi:propanol-preferring alcohol dehydrogenase